MVEQALWDLIGRRLGQPVWKLLGGYRDKVPAYGSTMCGDEVPGGLASPDDYAAFAERLVADGYHAIKLHTWMPPVSFAPDVAMDIRACAAVREAVGPDVPLMLDANHWYSRAEALQLGRALDRLGFHWYEEPMEEHSTRPTAGWRTSSTLPSSAPRASPGGWTRGRVDRRGRLRHPPRRRADAGGIDPALKSLHLAEAFGMDCEMHGGGAGNLAVLGAVPNSSWYERGLLHPHHDFDEVPPHLLGAVDPVDCEGYVHLSTEPGLGVRLDLDHIRSQTVRSW